STVTRRAIDAVAMLGIAAWLVLGWREADASHDRTLDLYTQGVAAELPAGAVYVAEGDVECFYGIPSDRGRRFPVAAPQISLGVYQREAAPKIEPRLFDGHHAYETWDEFLSECVMRGLTVAGAAVATVALAPAQPELHGLLLIAPPGGSNVVSRETI